MRIDRVKLITELARREWRDKELAERSGLSRATLSAIKGGKTVTRDTAQKIAHGLGVDVAELIEVER